MDIIVQEAGLSEPKDRQLVMALVYGVLRSQRYLDAVIQKFSRHPLKKMKNLTLQALRVGVLQICFMDKVPESAAVNETVKALRALRQPKWLTGFVNGLLRSLVREKNILTSLEKSLPDAVSLNHPDWMYDRWVKRYGKEQAKTICRINNLQPSLSLCLNLTLCDRDAFISQLTKAGFQAREGMTPESVRISDYRGTISQISGYDKGHFMVQDEGAQLISLMLCPLPAGTYLDACAGLGGKTIHLAAMLPQKSTLIAVEPNTARFTLLQENISRMCVSERILPVHSTLATFAGKTDNLFQAILVDAPCSGLGVIRRHPDIRWNRSPEDLKRYRKQQLALLSDTAPMLAPGGILVYATCSIEPEENEEVVTTFLKNHPDFSLDTPQDIPKSARHFIDENGYLKMLPDENHDGFFACRITKTVQNVK